MTLAAVGGKKTEPDRVRVALAVRGTVQGVGFRPFAWTLARRLGLAGSVRNAQGGVLVDVEGAAADVEAFVSALSADPPPLARVESIERRPSPVRGDRAFTIEPSGTGVPPASGLHASIAADVATCADCVRELFDPRSRRFRHPFATCTACGPRFTIVRSTPYDRAATTMAEFALCDACAEEYEDPSSRRFHAQAIACPACGPRLSFDGHEGAGAIEAAGRALRDGAIVAVKGIGGYHLACDARSDAAVGELRRRKRRDAKPFAVMAESADDAAAFAVVTHAERELLESPARPIVLLRRRADVDAGAEIATAVAPGLERVGVMLPYTPAHHLLLAATGTPIVLTSGNLSDEPIAFEDDDARARLGAIADGFLVHDRPIHTRCDDSIVHLVAGAPAVLRRSRGFAPGSIPLPSPLAAPTLALGGHLKAAFAFGERDRAVLGPHIGDLDQFEAWRSFRAALEHLRVLLGASPERVAHDLHPDYATSIHAEELALQGIARVPVQHHEAHVAACFARAGIDRRAIGVAFDGAGWGRDGAIWGGEVFVGTAGRLTRAARLRYVALPGGDRAAREPWRVAVAHLLDAGIDPGGALDPAFATDDEIRRVAEVARLSTTARTSSAGRLFDAVSAIVRVRGSSSHEAHAAMELQAFAERAPAAHDRQPYTFEVRDDAGGLVELDTRPLIRDVAEDVRRGAPAPVAARRFHATLAAATADVCRRIHARERLVGPDVALSGGVFANALLARLTAERLAERGLFARFCRDVPTNDGGLAYGQLAALAGSDARAETV